MLRDDGKPRYWVDGFDHWRLVLPVMLVGVLGILWLSPARRRAAAPSASPAGAAPVAQVAPAKPAAPTAILTPYAGQLMWPSRMADAEGTAEPNAVVTLYLGGRKLGETQAATDGRWRFQLLDFPPGRYSIRVEAWTGLQSIPSQEVSFMVAPEQSPAKAKQASKAKRTKPGTGSGAR